MKKIFLNRFFHRGSWKIGFGFEYDAIINDRVKSLPGCRYSGTKSCWYVDDSEESVKSLLNIFKGVAEVDISGIASTDSIGEKKRIDRVSLTGPLDETLVSSAELYEKNGKDRPVASNKKSGFDAVEFTINEADKRLSVRFTGRYDSIWVDELKSYGKLFYDKKRKVFMLPYSRLTADSLSDYFTTAGVEVRVIRPALTGEVRIERTTIGSEVRSRGLNDRAIEGIELLRGYLEENRYSARTIESYISQLGLFFRYFSDKDPDQITRNEVSDFVNNFIIRLGLSTSFQNQVISAIKTYYEISGNGRIIPQTLERPRRSKALPKVFSKEEVSRILNSVRNDKHKLLLWMIYSCGLRRSEVTNIRLDDLDRDRSILHIREGKGMVDRIVPVSDKVWSKIDSYLGSYRPKGYLFVGQGGGRYSSESVYSVFRNALKNAGIKRDVGVHSLRHSYATHLHENGLDIRYIQELLGHKSSRTTEIYTHVSRRNLIAVRSPIDDLDIK